MNRVTNDIPWIIKDCDETKATKLANDLGVSVTIARILVNRGVNTSEEASKYFNPSLSHLHDPFMLPDMEAGVERLARAIENKEKICIHGDYDVDGVTSAALLVRTLRALNADVEYRLPHRLRDGYDIKPAFVVEAAENGATLIITCDCGINAFDTVAVANELGVDVIITDHHEPGSDIPPAVAVINPKRNDSNYPFDGLAGVGVAFKFAHAVVKKLGIDEQKFLLRFLDLTALGTVGDVVPLLGENRTIVKFGLDAVANSKKVGLRSMIRAAGIAGKPMSTYSLAYILGPRINAVGRMDDAELALKLLLTYDENEAAGLVEQIERWNNERKAEQDRVLLEAVEQVESKNLDDVKVLVLSSVGWNPGVVGIVAGRIKDMYNRPAILLNRDDETKLCGGSARSIPAFNIVDALRLCSGYLHRFGGHALAAGMSLELDKLDGFEKAINKLADEIIRDEDLVPCVEADAEIEPEEATREFADLLFAMEPFGVENSEPVFISRGLTVIRKQLVGDGSHLRLTVQKNDSAPVNCIAFRQGEMSDFLELGGKVDLCYSIRLNSFNGSESVQFVVNCIKPI